MTRKLTQRELRNDSGEVMRALDAGEDFIVTRNGKPVGELRPYKRRQFVPTGELIAAFRGAPSIDYEELRADIDRHVDQDPTPRYWVE
jgi:prevent-host-death family protein